MPPSFRRALRDACLTSLTGVIEESVWSLGGEATVASEPGHGARLEIAFPVKAHG